MKHFILHSENFLGEINIVILQHTNNNENS